MQLDIQTNIAEIKSLFKELSINSINTVYEIIIIKNMINIMTKLNNENISSSKILV